MQADRTTSPFIRLVEQIYANDLALERTGYRWPVIRLALAPTFLKRGALAPLASAWPCRPRRSSVFQCNDHGMLPPAYAFARRGFAVFFFTQSIAAAQFKER